MILPGDPCPHETVYNQGGGWRCRDCGQPVDMNSPPPMAEQIRQLVMLLRDVADCGVEFDDERVRYVTVRIDRDTWNQLQAFRSPPGGSKDYSKEDDDTDNS